jgi:exodeoxyribonuclease V alpha subunit
MRSSAGKPATQNAQGEFSFAPPATTSPISFAECLRAIEAGTAALNLNRDCVSLAAEIAAFETDLDTEQRVALILLMVISLAALEEGSTRFPATGPESVQPIRRMLSPLCGDACGADGVERMRIAIEQMLLSGSAPGVIGAGPDDFKPLIYLQPFIYQQRILQAESTVARRLAVLVAAPRVEVADQILQNRLAEFATQTGASRRVEFSAEQRAAIGCAATGPLTIISGGPGTGKTSMVLAILKALLGAGLAPNQIALAAPTGKAAYRIGESIRENLPTDSDPRAAKTYPDPITVHRLLGYSPTRRRFHYHRNNPLEARVVIVDEGSMLDLELTSRLLDALRPDARLVILGDADQLPSVSAGAVFRDLLPSADEDSSPLSRNCVRLTRSYRMDSDGEGGGAIFKLASSINAGSKEIFAFGGSEGGDTAVTRRDSGERIDFVGAEWLDEATPSGAFLERWYAKQLHGNDDELQKRIFTANEGDFPATECELLRRVLTNLTRARILCITRVLDSGSDRINALLHRRVAHENGAPADRDRFMVGEPVMVLRNDYERTLFNGDQGVVLRVARPGFAPTVMAVFPRADNFLAFPLDALKEHLELCYAMTVHKAQGSEFDSVAVIMPSKDLPILSREILYTAVSRARRSVTIIGAKETIRAGLSRGIDRYSGLREQLASLLRDSQRA